MFRSGAALGAGSRRPASQSRQCLTGSRASRRGGRLLSPRARRPGRLRGCKTDARDGLAAPRAFGRGGGTMPGRARRAARGGGRPSFPRRVDRRSRRFRGGGSAVPRRDRTRSGGHDGLVRPREPPQDERRRRGLACGHRAAGRKTAALAARHQPALCARQIFRRRRRLRCSRPMPSASSTRCRRIS